MVGCAALAPPTRSPESRVASALALAVERAAAAADRPARLHSAHPLLSPRLPAPARPRRRTLKSKASVHTVIRELACSLAAPQSAFVCGFDFAFCTDAAIFMGEREGMGGRGRERGGRDGTLAAAPHSS